MVVPQRIPSANQTVDGSIISALLLVTWMLLLCPQMFDLNKCKFFLTKLFNNFFLNNNFQIKESIKAVEIRSKIGFQIHALSPFSDWLSFASRLGRHLDNISLKTVLRNRLFCLCSELSLIEVELYIYLTFYVADFLFYSSNPRLLRLSENYSCAKLSKNRN